jgi:hypothetical protein
MRLKKAHMVEMIRYGEPLSGELRSNAAGARWSMLLTTCHTPNPTATHSQGSATLRVMPKQGTVERTWQGGKHRARTHTTPAMTWEGGGTCTPLAHHDLGKEYMLAQEL